MRFAYRDPNVAGRAVEAPRAAVLSRRVERRSDLSSHGSAWGHSKLLDSYVFIIVRTRSELVSLGILFSCQAPIYEPQMDQAHLQNVHDSRDAYWES